MIRSQLFSRLPADKKEYYFLRFHENYHVAQNKLILCTQDKNIAFARLKELEAQGVACYVEDREGKRLS